MNKIYLSSAALLCAFAVSAQDFETYKQHVQNSCCNTSKDRKVTVEKMKDAYVFGSELFKATLL